MQVDILFQYVSGGSCDIGHDGSVLSQKQVQQRRFPCVRLAQDHGPDTFLYDLSVSDCF